MNIEYIHASKFGNGERVADKFKDLMSTRGVVVKVNHVRQVNPRILPAADLYVFSSPGRMGRPIGSMRRFLKGLQLPPGTRYAILNTEMRVAPEDAWSKRQRIIPIMTAALDEKGLTAVAVDRVYVTEMKGPLEDGWEDKVKGFADRLLRARAI